MCKGKGCLERRMSTLLLSALLFVLSACGSQPAHPASLAFVTTGGGSAGAIAALRAGTVDMIPSLDAMAMRKELDGLDAARLIASEKGGSSLACVFFNMRRAPGNDPAFRQAVARMIDRATVVNAWEDGIPVPVRTFVPPLSDAWTDAKALAPEFDAANARKRLDAAGYVFDEATGARISPAEGKPLVISVLTPERDSSEVLYDIGYSLVYYLNAMGVKASHHALPEAILSRRTMQARDYDLLVADARLAPAPFGLHAMLHSSRDVEWTSAWCGLHDEKADGLLETLWTSLDEADAQQAAKSLQALLAEQLPYVPVCSMPVCTVISTNWTGERNVPGSGAATLWSWLSLHPAAGGAAGLKAACAEGIETLNPLLADNADEWAVLQRICLPLFTMDPKTLAPAPVLAESWDCAEWTGAEGGRGMAVTFHLRKGAVWQDGEPFTSEDVRFCIETMKKAGGTAFEPTLGKIAEVETPDAATVIVRLNDRGLRVLYELAWFTVMPEHVWRDIADPATFEPWKETNAADAKLTQLVGQGPYAIRRDGSLADGVQLDWSGAFDKSVQGKVLLSWK